VRTVVFSHAAAREFDRLDATVRDRIAEVLYDFAMDPLSHAFDLKRLKGEHALRLRVGDWRMILEVSGTRIKVLAVAHRSAVYQRKN
jgi:mRNA interferase RelE/StbE